MIRQTRFPFGDYDNIIFVRYDYDFANANGSNVVGNAIYLKDNTTYFITDVIDLQGRYLICGQNTTIIGGSSENCRIKSTGLETALITSQYSLPIRNITIEADLALDLNGDGVTTALDWMGVNFTDCAEIGTIQNYSNFIMQDCAFLNSSGMTFDGTIGTIGFSQCLFNTSSGGTAIIISNTATITRRFRVIYSSFVTLSGEKGIDVVSGATIPVESYILDTVNFAGGGSYINGVGTATSDNETLFINCKGIQNTSDIGAYSMSNNATTTTISDVNTPVKILGTTTANAINQKFTHSNNRLTYVGALLKTFEMTAIASFTSGNNQEIGLYVAKNGEVIDSSEMYATTSGSGKAESISVQSIFNLSTNDYVEVWIENNGSAQDITVTYLNVIIKNV